MFAQITKQTKLLLAAGILVLTLTATTARADDAAVYAKAVQATCWIQTPGGSHGTGWVVDREQKLVVTNKHVVGTETDVIAMFPIVKEGQIVAAASEYLKLSSQLAIRGKVLARDAKRDLALIQLDSLPEGVNVLPLAETSAKIGDSLLSIGNSGLAGQPIEQGTLWKMRTGKVAIKSFRTLYYSNVNQNLETSMLNTSLGTRPGDSGGPVVNARGELVAVTSGGNGIGDSFAVDVTEVRFFLTKVLQANRQPTVSGPVLTGTYTLTWLNENAKRLVAGVTLRSDGTVLWEDEVGAQEGTYNLTNGQLTVILPGLRFKMTSAVTWTGSDMLRVTRNGTEYTMARR